jgi:hypothetical protein
MEKKNVRIPFVMSESELSQLDEWRAARHIWSRAEAIRLLITKGIEAFGLEKKPKETEEPK